MCVGRCEGMCSERINGAVIIPALSLRTNAKLRLLLYFYSQSISVLLRYLTGFTALEGIMLALNVE